MSTVQARIPPLSGADGSTNGWATRVTLQPIAAPSALGLAGFSVATLMVATIQAKWWGSAADFKGVAPFCLTFGGIAQFLAGMWAYKARDIVATLAHDFAELDKGPATRLAYGAERAAAIQKKLAGVVAHVERTVVRAVPELTFRTATPSENR